MLRPAHRNINGAWICGRVRSGVKAKVKEKLVSWKVVGGEIIAKTRVESSVTHCKSAGICAAGAVRVPALGDLGSRVAGCSGLPSCLPDGAKKLVQFPVPFLTAKSI